jgi:hypothetical protein
MTYVTYFIGVLTGFAKKHSKLVEAFLLVLIWVLSAFASGNADSGIYENRYNFYQSFTGMSEVGWQTLMLAFNSLGFEYQTFRCVLIAVELLLVASAIHRVTDEPCFVLAAYMIFPFCMDVVQMRFALADAIAFSGMAFLFEPVLRGGAGIKHGRALFICLILLASLFHFIAILYLLLLLIPRLRTVSSVFAVLGVSVLVALIANWSGLTELAAIVGVGTKYETLRSYSINANLLYTARVVLCCLAWSTVFIFACRDSGSMHVRDAALKLNWIVLAAVVPLIFLSADFYRIQQGITLLNLCFISRFLVRERPLRFSKRNAGIVLAVAAISLMNLYLYALGATNIHTVFFPLFESNLILSGF